MTRAFPLTQPGARIGLLGGSFNPAHKAHVNISEIALRRLGLDQVWWLVSPQNPLKAEKGMAPFKERYDGAVQLVQHPRIHVSDWEARNKTRFTADTLVQLTKRYPATHFVWLMGGDNLATIHKWQNWQRIFDTVPVAVIARPGYIRKALASPATKIYAPYRLNTEDARFLPALTAPAWVLLQERHDPISATAIREGRA